MIACSKPAVFGKDFGGGVGPLPVTLHDARAFDLKFVIVTQTKFYVRKRRANRGRIVVMFFIDGQNRARFGHPVALVNRNAQTDKSAGNVLVQSGAP